VAPHFVEARSTPRLYKVVGMGKTYDDYVREAFALVSEVTVEQARGYLEAGPAAAVFLDIREPNETAKGTIPGALTIPRGRIERDAPDWVFDPEAPLVVCCNSGKLSALATRTLLEMGFSGARTLKGGLAAWQAAGAPLGEPRPM